MISHDQYTINKRGSDPENRINTFSLKIYTATELQAILHKNEFEIIDQYDINGNRFIADKRLNMLTVARKK